MDKTRYSEEGFESFLRELIVNNRLSDAKEVGIAKLVIDKGIDSLSEKQKFVFEKSIEYYVFDKCARCGCEIIWSEMSAAEDNGGLCSWCQQLSSHDD